MKNSILVVCGLLISSLAFAQQQGGQAQSGQGQNRGQKFQEMKQRLLDRIDQRINTLQDAKSCVDQAQDPQALKACRPQHNEGDQKSE
jgi:uncharacterized protein YdeI (BOF family)